MRQATVRGRSRRKQCLCCRGLFFPDPRTKDKQRYCSALACQTQRQRKNETDWRARNPESLQMQREQSRLWHKDHAGYSRIRRQNNPAAAAVNRSRTGARMRRLRAGRRFAKSKVILTQLTGGKSDTCYLTRGARWLILRLTKASPLSKCLAQAHNRKRLKQTANRLPKGWFYEFSGCG